MKTKSLALACWVASEVLFCGPASQAGDCCQHQTVLHLLRPKSVKPVNQSAKTNKQTNRSLFQKSKEKDEKLSMVLHTPNLSIGEAEAGGL